MLKESKRSFHNFFRSHWKSTVWGWYRAVIRVKFGVKTMYHIVGNFGEVLTWQFGEFSIDRQN